MTKYIKIIFAACIVLAAAMAGCKKDKDPEQPKDITITIAAISGITAPVAGATPVTTVPATEQYTATITWQPADATFAHSTAYTATVTLTAKAGYMLTGVAANFFTVAGATVTSEADKGVVTAVFPATAAAPALSVEPDELSFTAAGGEETFDITANIAWTITGHAGEEWLTLSETSGSGNATITVTADANATTAVHTATLTVAAQGLPSKTVTVTQEAGSEAKIDETRYATFAEALTAALAENRKTVTLLKDVEYNAQIEINTKSVTFDLNGFTFDLVNTGTNGLFVRNDGHFTLIEAGGEFNVTGNSYGSAVSGVGSIATVTNAKGYYGVYVVSGGIITVTGNVTGKGVGAYVRGGGEVAVL